MEQKIKNKPLRWRKIRKDRRAAAKAFLMNRERFCVSASARFLGIKKSRGHVWYLNNSIGEISALLLHSHRSLYPVFDQNPRVPGPRFLNRFLGKLPIHAIQGLREDTEILEALVETQGYFAAERIDYDLMSIDTQPRREALNAGPANLVLRNPVKGDEEGIFILQAAYEQEEVIPQNAVFNPSVCRLNLEHILSTERVLIAVLDGQIVGKINTSAESFARYQIGGVYVHPSYRGLGIAVKMTAVFVQNLLALGKGVTLFVKQRNNTARTVYRKVGLSALADYRISYY